MQTRNSRRERVASLALAPSTAGRAAAAGRARATLAAAALALSAQGCSAIVDTDLQCNKHSDCRSFSTVKNPFACNMQRHVCTPLYNDQCTPQAAGMDGPRSIGAFDGDGIIADDTIILGSVLTLSGDYKDGGLAPRDSMEFAVSEIMTTAAHGIPDYPSGTKQLMILECDDRSNSDVQPIAAARHLAEDVGVPAIIGGTGTDATVAMANEVTIDDKVLLFSPSATGTSLTGLPKEQGNNLVWRTAPSDTFQAHAMATYTQQVLGVAAQNAKVVIVNNTNEYGNGLFQEVNLSLTNAGITPITAGYKDGTDPTPSAAMAVQGGLPDVAILIGYNEVAKAIQEIESHVTAGNKKPIYLLSDGGQADDVYRLTEMNMDLRSRIFGTAFGQPDTAPAYAAFSAAFRNKIAGAKPNIAGTAGTYDIVYLLTFAMTHLLAQSQPITGPALSGWLSQVNKDPKSKKVSPGTGDLGPNLSLAQGNAPFGFDGASGPLQFDQNGEAPGNILIWCISPSTNGAKNSGVYVDIAGKLQGTLPASCD